ncbi:MAG TPA: PadR family transcriptional regulator [Vicinamibacterales bacterium]|nr:PadR family transcriptional regulator [Vicinamibacterales bacterium]
MSYKSHGATPLYLGEFELLVLLAVIRTGIDAYGVTIREELSRKTSREPSLGAVYKTLGRLERKGYVSVRIGDPTPERGGRRKKLYQLEPLGARALKQSFAAFRRLTRDLGPELETP